MQSIRAGAVLVGALAVLACSGGVEEESFPEAVAEQGALAGPTRTPWEMHDGLEGGPWGQVVPFACAPQIHGDVCEYSVSFVPPSQDPGWGPAPDAEVIGFSLYPSRVCWAPVDCMAYGDFTYFQTFVTVPANVAVTEFTIAFNGMDDGSRVSIYNSSYPDGLVVPGSYVYLGGSGTANLAPFVRSGEVNRVVVTQVDDCCIQNNLHSAVVVLNGEPVETGCETAADCDGRERVHHGRVQRGRVRAATRC